MSPPARQRRAGGTRSGSGPGPSRRPALVAPGLEDALTGRRQSATATTRSGAPVDPARDCRDRASSLAERLYRVVVGPKPERPDLGGLAALARHDDRRGPTRASARDVEPVRPGITRSSRTGRDAPRQALTAVRSQAVMTWWPSVPTRGGDGSHHRGVVVDDEDAEGAAAHADHGPRSSGSDGHGGRERHDESGAMGSGGLAPQVRPHRFTESFRGVQADPGPARGVRVASRIGLEDPLSPPVGAA
jgi:hypothetical protein